VTEGCRWMYFYLGGFLVGGGRFVAPAILALDETAGVG
jgi:hypothetical protein